MLLCSMALAEEMEIPLLLTVNTEKKFESFVLMRDFGEVLIPEEDFSRLGIQSSQASVRVHDHRYVPLSAYAGRIQHVFDEKQLRLDLTVDPRLLQSTRVDYARPTASRNLFGIDSAFFNFSLTERRFAQQTESYLDVPMEAVLHAHDTVVRSTFLYRKETDRRFLARGMTTLIRDDQAGKTRFSFGDVNARSGELGGSAVLGGIKFAKEFSISPYTSTHPGVDVQGLLETPSRVDLYINHTLLRSEELPAGQFTLTNLPNLYGAGEARLRITDAFGRQTENVFPYYVSSRLLKKNLHEYSYALGLQRDTANLEVPTYIHGLTTLGFHRYGVQDYLTVGYRFETGRDLLNIGPTMQFLLGYAGEVAFGGAYSQVAGQEGMAGFARYAYSSRYFHFRYGIRSLSSEYGNVSVFPSDLSVVQSESAGIGVHGLRAGALSLNYSNTRYYNAPGVRQASFTYNVRVGRRGALLLRASRDFMQDGTRDALFASFTMTLGRRTTGNASYSEQDDQFLRQVYLQQNVPGGEGLGFRFRRGESQNTVRQGDWLGDISGTYKCRWCVISSTYIKSEETQTYQNSFASSVAFVDNRFFLTRPIRDSFALVKVGGLDDVRVFNSNELMGITRDGDLLIPSLTSYSQNRISIEPQDVPVEMGLDYTRQVIAPQYRSGGVVDFPVTRFQGFSATLYWQKDGRRQTADFARLVLTQQQNVIETLIGFDGTLYVENLNPGRYQAHLSHKGRECKFDVEIPESEDTVVEMGELACRL